MECTEPPEKRAKMADDSEEFISKIISSKNNLKAVLSDDYYNNIPLINVYAGYVKDQKMFSNTIAILNKNVPLKELQHLKRVCKSCILLCPLNYLNNPQESIQDFIESHVPDLREVFDYFKNIEVPMHPPKTKRQNAECNKKWACNFHPDRYIERLLSDSFFKKEDLETHRGIMGMAFEVLKWHISKDCKFSIKDIMSSDMNVAVVVDPSIESIVAVAFDDRKNHPIKHATMIAIDNVAKTQNGGAWSKSHTNIETSGLDNDVLVYLKEKHPQINFGSKKFVKAEVGESKKNENPYLCTGYDIYLLREPCLMCAMGLVHGRIKRVFFCFDNPTQGALKSNTKLHCNPSLNHRFEVFTGFH